MLKKIFGEVIGSARDSRDMKHAVVRLLDQPNTLACYVYSVPQDLIDAKAAGTFLVHGHSEDPDNVNFTMSGLQGSFEPISAEQIAELVDSATAVVGVPKTQTGGRKELTPAERKQRRDARMANNRADRMDAGVAAAASTAVV